MAAGHRFHRITKVTDLLLSIRTTEITSGAVAIRAATGAIQTTSEPTTISVVVTAWADFHGKVPTAEEHGQSAVRTVVEPTHEAVHMVEAESLSISAGKAFRLCRYNSNGVTVSADL